MSVLGNASDPCLTNQPVQLVPVTAHQRVVLLDDEFERASHSGTPAARPLMLHVKPTLAGKDEPSDTRRTEATSVTVTAAST